MTTGGRIRRQQDQFWRWFYGNSKDGLDPSLLRVVETFEELQSFHDQHHSANDFAWDAFTHFVLSKFVVRSSWTKRPDHIEQQMRSTYRSFIEAKLGDPIFTEYVDYETDREKRRQFRESLRYLSGCKHS